MATKANEIRQRIDQIDELLNRMREAYNDSPETPVGITDSVEVRERERSKKSVDPSATSHLVDPDRQYTDNLALAGLTNPEVFGRNRDGSKVVVKSSGLKGGSGLPPEAKTKRQTHPTGKGGDNPSMELPSWERLGVTGKTVEEAVSVIEGQARNAATHPTTTGAVTTMEESSAVDEPLSTELPVEPSTEPHGSAELTNPAFAYQEGESAHDQWVREHTPGLEVRGGEGKLVDDDEYGVTATFVVPNRRK